MAITLQSINDFLDDLRVDNTPGTVDVNSEGLRAVNFILQDLQSRHDWEFTQLDDDFRFYPGVYSYSLPSSFKSLRSVYPASTYFDDYRMVEPTVFKRLTRNGSYWENLVAIERAGIQRLFINNATSSGESTVVTSNSGYDTDGTWVGTLDAVNVRTDGVIYHENGGSVSFDIDVSNSA